MGREKQRCILTKTPTLGTVTHNWKGSHKYGTFPWGERGLCPHQAPQSLRPALERGVPKCLALKTTGLMFRRTTGLYKMEILLLKGSHVNSLTWGPSVKATVWKDLRPYEEIHLLILQCLSEGQKPTGILSRDRGICKHHILCFASTLLVLVLVGAIFALSL